MESAALFKKSPDMLPDAVISSGTVDTRSASAPEVRNTTNYGRFSIAQSDAQPVYCLNSVIPVMPQAREPFPSCRFGSGVSSVGNMSRNLSLHNQHAMVPVFDPYLCAAQAGFDMGSVFGSPYNQAATSTIAVDVGGERCRSASADTIISKVDKIMSKVNTIKRKADTSEANPQRAEPELKIRKTRVVYQDWQLQELNNAFQRSRHLTIHQKRVLASRLHITEEQVRTWFQNKRAAIKKEASLVRESQSAQSMRASEADSLAFSTKQPMYLVSRQEVDAQQTYTLLCEKNVISTTMAKSPAEALQAMSVNLKGNPLVRSSLAVADYSQSGSPEPELPAITPTGELTDDESDFSDSTDT